MERGGYFLALINAMTNVPNMISNIMPSYVIHITSLTYKRVTPNHPYDAVICLVISIANICAFCKTCYAPKITIPKNISGMFTNCLQ